MKRFFAAFSVLTFLTIGTAGVLMAQLPADPQDSIIIETKAVDTSLTSIPPAAPAFVVQVLLTNKDSLAYLTLVLRESTTTGCRAYALLNRTGTGVFTFGSVVNAVNGTMNAFTGINTTQYNDNSPDGILLAGGDDGSFTLAELPNLARHPVWELKFRHSSGFDSIGAIWFDSTRINSQSCLFTTVRAVDWKVNFLPGRLHVCPDADTLVCPCIPTSVNDVRPGVIPGQYALSQNYPNPFNANTQISFALPKAGKTTLEIFNILGQKVNTLVNEYMTAGYKIVNWDGRDERGSEVASGIYFYRLRSQDYLQTKRALLMK
ncbi:MAG: T9SS type A sorting domain-containing protein [candidate division Zixibacteria bacterium]|nr:T9SS type A sorting domain-containing protein [candidate division Zixibacteria bacterium]